MSVVFNHLKLKKKTLKKKKVHWFVLYCWVCLIIVLFEVTLYSHEETQDIAGRDRAVSNASNSRKFKEIEKKKKEKSQWN